MFIFRIIIYNYILLWFYTQTSSYAKKQKPKNDHSEKKIEYVIPIYVIIL